MALFSCANNTQVTGGSTLSGVGQFGPNNQNPNDDRVFIGLKRTYSAVAPGERFGFQTAALSDINFDGVREVAVMSEQGVRLIDPTFDPTVSSTADATIWYVDRDSSSPNSSVLLCPVFSLNSDFYPMANIGDIDGDQVDDLAIGDATSLGFGRGGTLCLLSGADGSNIRLEIGDNRQDGFGISIIGLGDINHDQVADFAVGAYFEDENGDSAGAVYVYDGASMARINKVIGEEVLGFFGVALANAGDIDGGGASELIVGAYGMDGPGGDRVGAVYVLSGEELAMPQAGSIAISNTQALLYKIVPSVSRDFSFGGSIDGGVDMDGDTVPDFIVGAPGNGNVQGHVFGYSGVDGAELFVWDQASNTSADCFNGKSNYGETVAFVGDLRPGYPVGIAVGDPSYSRNAATCGSGKIFVNGIDVSAGFAPVLIFDVFGSAASAALGMNLGPVGDVNGDGFDELLFGRPNFQSGNGSVAVFNLE